MSPRNTHTHTHTIYLLRPLIRSVLFCLSPDNTHTQTHTHTHTLYLLRSLTFGLFCSVCLLVTHTHTHTQRAHAHTHTHAHAHTRAHTDTHTFTTSSLRKVRSFCLTSSSLVLSWTGLYSASEPLEAVNVRVSGKGGVTANFSYCALHNERMDFLCRRTGHVSQSSLTSPVKGKHLTEGVLGAVLSFLPAWMKQRAAETGLYMYEQVGKRHDVSIGSVSGNTLNLCGVTGTLTAVGIHWREQPTWLFKSPSHARTRARTHMQHTDGHTHTHTFLSVAVSF